MIDQSHILPIVAALAVCVAWAAIMLGAHAPGRLWVLTIPAVGAAAVIVFVWVFEKTR
jgi:hypothetical protein